MAEFMEVGMECQQKDIRIDPALCVGCGRSVVGGRGGLRTAPITHLVGLWLKKSG